MEPGLLPTLWKEKGAFLSGPFLHGGLNLSSWYHICLFPQGLSIILSLTPSISDQLQILYMRLSSQLLPSSLQLPFLRLLPYSPTRPAIQTLRPPQPTDHTSATTIFPEFQVCSCKASGQFFPALGVPPNGSNGIL